MRKISRTSLRLRVYERLKALIVTNRLSPGQEMGIDLLAGQLSVSQTPVREALAMLEMEGLVVMGQHKTPRVTDVSTRDVHDVYEMRILLEGWAAEKSADLVADSDLDRAEEMLAEVEKEAHEDRLSSHLDADIAVHQVIIRPIRNELFQRLYGLVGDRSIRIRSLAEAHSAQQIVTITKEHREIVDALRSHRPTSARERVVHHLQRAMARTLSALSEMKSG